MSVSHGIILLDKNEIILRVYQANEKEWQLLHYVKKDLSELMPAQSIEALDITRIIADLFSETYTQHVLSWRVCARGLPIDNLETVASTTGLRVEYIDKSREQELL